MKERTKFVFEWERRWKEAQGGPVNMVELCRLFGISRQTGYLWVRRYREGNHDPAAVEERSRRPLTSPLAIPQDVQDLIVRARKDRPKWGPRKLHTRLAELNPGKFIPSASVIAKILKHRGLTTPRRRSRRAPATGVAAPFSGCNESNAVWCIDFKGWFLTADGRRCYPLTLLDAFARYLLRCEALIDPDGWEVRRILESAFEEFGVPAAIRSDGGPPFASTGPARLTELSVWLLRLGLRVEIIAPGKPQQNGRLERFHRTLKSETTIPPAADQSAQQRVFDLWRGEYNHERPHEALDQRPPGRIYQPSKRRYPRPLIEPEFDLFSKATRVDKNGFIRWQQRSTFISSALKYEYIELHRRLDVDGRWDVRWGQIPLGYLDEHRPQRGLVYPRRRRGAREVSGMSYG